jgi:chemotaxis protein MotA
MCRHQAAAEGGPVMLMIVGFVTVLITVLGGFLLEGGALGVLNQPAEFVIIFGAAVGGLIVGTPAKTLVATAQQIKAVLAGQTVARADYQDLLSMLYQLFKVVQQSGVMGLETHFDDPAKSPILSRYPKFLGRHEALDFLADSAKVLIVGGISSHDFDALMDEDLRVHHDQALQPSAALARVGDALPGLGIVAAVLGIVITMGHIDGPPEEIGHRVGAALVGTFLGVLLSYGFIQPLASLLETRVGDEAYYCLCIKAGLVALHKGNPPAIAVEFARRVLPHHVRPTFDETEGFCRASVVKGEAVAA